MNLEDTIANTSTDIVELFRQHFASIFVSNENNCDSENNCDNLNAANSSLINLSSCDISIIDVFNSIMDLKNNIGSGPDGIPVEF